MDRDEKINFDALMALADFRLKRIFNRRDYEWKVTLGLWALLAAGIANPQPLRDLHCFSCVPVGRGLYLPMGPRSLVEI